MHPHIESDEHYHDNATPPFIIIDLPPLCDEAAMQFSELLKELTAQFNAYYRGHIRRAARARRKQEQMHDRELELRAAQHVLPIFDAERPF